MGRVDSYRLVTFILSDFCFTLFDFLIFAVILSLLGACQAFLGSSVGTKKFLEAHQFFWTNCWSWEQRLFGLNICRTQNLLAP